MDKQLKDEEGMHIVPELTPHIKKAIIQSSFVDSAKQVELPIFFIKNDAPEMSLFGRPEDVELQNAHLLESFKLSAQDANISFAAADATMYKVDIDEQIDEHALLSKLFVIIIYHSRGKIAILHW